MNSYLNLYTSPKIASTLAANLGKWGWAERALSKLLAKVLSQITLWLTGEPWANQSPWLSLQGCQDLPPYFRVRLYTEISRKSGWREASRSPERSPAWIQSYVSGQALDTMQNDSGMNSRCESTIFKLALGLSHWAQPSILGKEKSGAKKKAGKKKYVLGTGLSQELRQALYKRLWGPPLTSSPLTVAKAPGAVACILLGLLCPPSTRPANMVQYTQG